MYSLGLDIGSSSIKVALVDIHGENETIVLRVPENEMIIDSLYPQWAEQDADEWWQHSLTGIQMVIRMAGIQASQIKSIGIAYQMHGLVLVGKNGKPLRPCIIWCDSRAIASGQMLLSALDQKTIKSALYNNPGNFTASKLKWVKDHEPEVFNQIYKIMLPGDYISYKMSGAVTTTYSGMSEGVFFDFDQHEISYAMLQALGTDLSVFPDMGGSFDTLSKTNEAFEKLTGILAGTPISYRAGDQPNNAFSLGVLDAGEAAGTGGTSGVIYTVSKTASYDSRNRVNTFAHVNHTKEEPSYGTLLCINGTGILYNWVKNRFFADLDYFEMEKLAQQVLSEGIIFLPFGNGAERMLENQVVSANILGLDFNRHDKRHILRAGLEGITFAFVYGLDVLEELGIKPSVMRVGNDNLFQSEIFSQTLADVAGITIKVYESTGAIGAAKGAAYGAALVSDLHLLNRDLREIRRFEPQNNDYAKEMYNRWKNELTKQLA